MTNPALDSLIALIESGGDARLLIPALDLCTDGPERARVLALVSALDIGTLPDTDRARAAALAADARLWPQTLALADGVDSALASAVGALLALGRIAEAETRYRAAVVANPTLEDPALDQAIADARAEAGPSETANILAFNRRTGSGGDTGPLAPPELDAARIGFAVTGPAMSFADVGGLDDVKKQIHRRIIAPFQKPSLFARFRRSAGGGVLLYGPPGCGKTLIARATAGECNARFINVPVTDILDKYIGEPERKLAAIFADARRETPTVLFFDELEALAGKRSHQTSQHEISIVSTFLAELDGFAKNNDGVLILAATNMPWGVDAAFRRSGRFDRLLFVPPPDRVARAAILDLQLAGRPLAADVDTAAIAARCPGYSGADLENLVNTAADIAIEESVASGSEQPIAMHHLDEALGEVRATTAEWLTTARNFSKYGNSGGQYDEVAEFLKKNGR